jgi:two-component system OmpR family response regulator
VADRVNETIHGAAENAHAPGPLSGDGRHVLVVEDDGELRKLLLSALRRSNFRANGARDGIEMWRLLASASVDLVLLDVMLPGKSGFDLCRELRAQGSMPIILLTALGETPDRVAGLELGADDFVVKPADSRELVARIRAVLRRVERVDPQMSEGREIARFGGWMLDTRRRELQRPDGGIVDLTSGEYDVLLAFVERPQRVLTRDQLLDVARNRPFGGLDRSMDVQVSRLRSKMGARPHDEGEPGLIKTVRGIGYILSCPVEWNA